MATDKDLIIKITAETDKAVKEIKKLTTEVKKFSKTDDKLAKNSAKNTKTVGAGFTKLGLTMGGLVTATAALGIAMKALEFKDMAADAEQSADAFDRIFTDMGVNAEEAFLKIKESSKNLIPDSAIKQSAVTAASLGVPIEKLAELMEVARVKAREMGTDAQSAFNDLAVGIGRGSPMILDNLGLTIKLDDANKKLAASLGKTVAELTKEEKALALTNEVIAAGAESVKRYSNAELTAKQRTQQFDASVVKLKEKIGGALLPAMNSLTESTTAFINAMVSDDPKKALTDIENKIKDVNNALFAPTSKKPVAVTKAVEEAIRQGFDFSRTSVMEMTDELGNKMGAIELKVKPKVDTESFIESWNKEAPGIVDKTIIKPKLETDKKEIENFMTIIDKETGKETVKLKVGVDVKNSMQIMDKDTKNIVADLKFIIPAELNKEATAQNVISTLKRVEAENTQEIKVKTNIVEGGETLKDFLDDAQGKADQNPIVVPVIYTYPNGKTSPGNSVSDQFQDEIDSLGGQ